MDLNPLHGLSKLGQASFSLGKEVVKQAEHAGEDIKQQVDSAVFNAKALPGAASSAELVMRVKQMLSGAPQQEQPLVAPPDVRPLNDHAVQVQADKPTELLPAGHGPLSLEAHNPAAIRFEMPASGDGQLSVRAAGPGTDWGKKGSESAVMAVFVDGKYNQDLVLYGGKTPTDYPLSLGPLGAGPHTITFAYNQKGSTKGATGVQLSSAQLVPPSTGDQGLVEKYQPYLYSRGAGTENNHTDTPLLMVGQVQHEGQDTVIKYITVHSNEDGGDGAHPMLAQSTWGRTTDLATTCYVTVGPDSKVKNVKFSGPLDQEYNFHGTFEGDHPVLRIATTNNSYIDEGTGAFLFRPRAQLATPEEVQTRENLMDAHPWIYRVANEELKREGKELTDAEATAMLAHQGEKGFKVPGGIEDVRHYLYVQYGTDNGHSPVAVEVKLKGQDQWYRSDLGNPDYDIGGESLPPSMRHHFYSSTLPGVLDKVGINLGERAGSGLRTTVPLPPGTKPSDIEDIRFVNNGDVPVPFRGVEKAFMLDDAYEPRYLDVSQDPGSIAPRTPLDRAPRHP